MIHSGYTFFLLPFLCLKSRNISKLFAEFVQLHIDSWGHLRFHITLVWPPMAITRGHSWTNQKTKNLCMALLSIWFVSVTNQSRTNTGGPKLMQGEPQKTSSRKYIKGCLLIMNRKIYFKQHRECFSYRHSISSQQFGECTNSILPSLPRKVVKPWRSGVARVLAAGWSAWC